MNNQGNRARENFAKNNGPNARDLKIKIKLKKAGRSYRVVVPELAPIEFKRPINRNVLLRYISATIPPRRKPSFEKKPDRVGFDKRRTKTQDKYAAEARTRAILF